MSWCGVADSCYNSILTLPMAGVSDPLGLSCFLSQCHGTWAPVDFSSVQAMLCLCAHWSPLPPCSGYVRWFLHETSAGSGGGINVLWGKPWTTGRQELMGKFFPSLHNQGWTLDAIYIILCEDRGRLYSFLHNTWSLMSVKEIYFEWVSAYIALHGHHVEVGSLVTGSLNGFTFLLCFPPFLPHSCCRNS